METEVFDKEYLEKQSNKEIIASIFLGVLRYIPIKETGDEEKYKEELKSKLKFKNRDDAELLTAGIYLLEDTESAILNYLQFGLFVNGGREDLGEAYLRLYGVLNAVYLQLFCVIEFIELFNFPGKKGILNMLTSLEVYRIRNAIAAHSINYQTNLKAGKNKLGDFYKISRPTLTKWGGKIYIISGRNKSVEVNLLNIIKNYVDLTDKLLLNVSKKAIFSLFPNNSENRKWLLNRFQFVSSRLNDLQITNEN